MKELPVCSIARPGRTGCTAVSRRGRSGRSSACDVVTGSAPTGSDGSSVWLPPRSTRSFAASAWDGCVGSSRAPVIRYEWPEPGDLVHLDTKKLGRIDGVGKRFGGPRSSRSLGWDVVHVAIDDHSRLAYVEQLPDELGETAAAFLERALTFFASHGIAVRRVMTDNGSPYVSKAFALTCSHRQLRHIRTRPYTPRTNGKAEAMVKLLINSWAYARPYQSSARRAKALQPFIETYNHRRPHGGLNGARPIERVRQ
jgi:transposase InsO family protein